MTRSLLGRLLAALAVASCGVFDRAPLPPEGQLVIGISTDAWLPRSAGEAYEPVARSPLFERLRIELFAPGEQEPCRDCLRDFGIDHGTVAEGRATVGFVPRPDVTGYRARVRLYHSGASESSAEPRRESTIETVIALPAVAADGIVEIHVALMTDDLSRPRGTLDAPLAAEAGPPPKGLAGTWHQDVLRDCAEPARTGEACVPGGAFWMGDPAFALPYERLVALSPFYIDAHEVTTGEVRATGLATLDAVALQADPYLYSSDATKNIHYCTYTQVAGDREELPVNCVSRTLAQKICAKRDAALVSEAQFEFVAGARRDATFPWGETEPGCADAVYARGYDAKALPELRRCTAQGVGAAKPGSGLLDRVRMPDGNEIVDLAGNLAEWMLDDYQSLDEPCYALNPLVDLVCREPSMKTPGLVSLRSEPWTDLGGSELRAATRQHIDAKVVQDPRIGFRCARPGR